MAVEEWDDTKKSEAEGTSPPTEEKATGKALQSEKQCDEEEPPGKAEENPKLETKDEEAVVDKTEEEAVEESDKDEHEGGPETEEIKMKQETDDMEGGEGTPEGVESVEGDDKEKSVSVSPKTSSVRRPTRERKTVERYSAPSPVGRSSGSKSLTIAQGTGTRLKDIPNVAYKLSKRKPDDNLQLLHTILFGKKAKAHALKRDIGNFSGFVWTENEEKQKTKIKEKLDKCVKEKLLDFCDVLNIPFSKTTSKKEDLSVKLLEFLQSPCSTTEVLLANKDLKGKKRKSKSTSSRSANSKEASTGKLFKKAKIGEKEKKASINEEESDHDDSEHSDANVEFMEQDDEDQSPMEESDEDNNSQEGHKSKEITAKSSSKNTESKSGEKSTDSKKDGTGKSSDIKPNLMKKVSSSYKKAVAASEDPPLQGKSPSKKSKIDTKSTEQSGKKQLGKSSSNPKIKEGGGTTSKNAKKGPTKEELYAVVVQILKEADFDTATLSDILRQLGTHFKLDLMHRKAEVKEIITEAINNMSDAEDEEEDASDDAEETGDDKDDA